MKLRKKVVVIGGGFAGLSLTRALAKSAVHVNLIDRSNHHLFQPLLYQVAMAGLSPGEIAVPIRAVLSRQANAKVFLAEVAGVDFDARRVLTREMPPIDYDYLVVAAGAVNSYFGHNEWAEDAPGLKDLDDAVEIRRRVLLAFEAAERETSAAMQRRHLTFVVIGGGPTGVELAGAIAELATIVLSRDFRSIDSDATRVVLIEGGDRILPHLHPELSELAADNLRAMGVEVRTGLHVTSIDCDGVTFGGERLTASTVLWAAGVRGSPLCERMGLDVDRQGRAKVLADCSVPGHPEVFVLGDAAAFVPEGAQRALPGVSPVAMQQGRFVARQIERSINGKPREAFVYVDKGSMATIGRKRAVAQFHGLRLNGFFAWVAWLFVHVFYLIDFRNRIVVLLDWTWAYFAYRRGSRLITGRRLHAGSPASISMHPPPADATSPSVVPASKGVTPLELEPVRSARPPSPPPPPSMAGARRSPKPA
ncbi:MAG TPA: NAD(P)/FAD-dependent oxidoreductase [Polyangiaceae bacterium]|nr:NAD(P)/FAD-dependent oxidoreductase [Polyangiaceae bacterium]